MEYEKFFIGGHWVSPATDKRVAVIGAATEESIGSAPEAATADVDRAVSAAAVALPAWSSLSVAQRSVYLRRFADALAKRSAEIARRVSMQNGMPTLMSRPLEGLYPVGLLQYYADLAERLQVEELRPSSTGTTTLVRRLPVGVVGAIVPWNYPVTLSMMKIAPALVAGCTVVCKPSLETMLDSYLVAEAAEEAGIPAGVLNWIPGGREVGAYLAGHEGVDKVAFTGSTAAGRRVAEVCGKLLRPVSLELGGKSAALLLPDADLAAFASAIPNVSMLNNGQTCFACTRILAPQARYDEVVEAVVAAVRALPVGDPLDSSTVVGPLASALQRERVEQYIQTGRQEARLVCGGGRPAGLERGWFVEPTVFADVSNAARIAQEEIFGPVLAIVPYRDEVDAVAIANDSAYGLGGTVWSADQERALTVARQVVSGTVGVNNYLLDMNAPFGGVKASGLGREMGPESLAAYQVYNSIYLPS